MPTLFYRGVTPLLAHPASCQERRRAGRGFDNLCLVDPAAERLRDAFVAAYRPYLQARLDELGLKAPDSLPGAMAAGEVWLHRELVALLQAPAERQARGPLEIFQEAVRFPTRALESAGIPPAPRDPVAANALPGDVYDLAPASSSALGEEAWQAHVAWGAHKARALTGRSLTVVSTNLLDWSRVESAARVAGYDVVVDASLVPTLAMVDLAAPSWE